MRSQYLKVLGQPINNETLSTCHAVSSYDGKFVILIACKLKAESKLKKIGRCCPIQMFSGLPSSSLIALMGRSDVDWLLTTGTGGATCWRSCCGWGWGCGWANFCSGWTASGRRTSRWVATAGSWQRWRRLAKATGFRNWSQMLLLSLSA